MIKINCNWSFKIRWKKKYNLLWKEKPLHESLQINLFMQWTKVKSKRKIIRKFAKNSQLNVMDIWFEFGGYLIFKMLFNYDYPDQSSLNYAWNVTSSSEASFFFYLLRKLNHFSIEKNSSFDTWIQGMSHAKTQNHFNFL